MPHCTDGTAIFPDASLPSTASYRYRQAFAFAQPIRFAATPASQPHKVWALWSGPTAGPRLRVRAPVGLLTVEGYAVLERQPAGTLYAYDAPNGRWSMSDLTLESVSAIRRRLRVAGVVDSAIATQLNPNDGRWYVQVRSPDVPRNDLAQTAIEHRRNASITVRWPLVDDLADERNELGISRYRISPTFSTFGGKTLSQIRARDLQSISDGLHGVSSAGSDGNCDISFFRERP